MTGGIHVNADRCIGAAQCVRHAPDVFSQDDGGVVLLLPDAAERGDVRSVREAALACPVQAITLRAAAPRPDDLPSPGDGRTTG